WRSRHVLSTLRELQVTGITSHAGNAPSGAVVSVAYDPGGTVGSQFGHRFAATAGVSRTG
ncbi:MAG TPA: hypothetical protein P5307_22940, partial [Pirellulaceae bacterium]|nr:hypothetical protein [Pirellulaceae bacterium]